VSERDEKARRALALKAWNATGHTSDAEEVNAFLTRYGSAADIADQIARIEQLREFLTKHVGDRIAAAAGDGEALDALKVVETRLQELHDAAKKHQWLMDVLGWQFDGQTLKYAPPKKPGRKKALETMTMTALFKRMLATGWPASNSAEAREHIRREMLARGFDPAIATPAKIENAVNAVLNPTRHY
jgi:hypothetical protein